MATLIWRRGLRGPSPAISLQDFVDEYDRRAVLAKHKLPPEHLVLSIAELVDLYPPPKDIVDDASTLDPKLP